MYSSLLPLSWLELESCFEPLNWRIWQDVSQLHLTVHLLCAAPGAHPVSFPFPELALEQRSDMFLLEKKQRSGSRLSEMASTWFGQKEDWTILNLENLAHLRPSTCCCLHASKCHMWHCCCQAKGANWCSLECTQLRIWGPICRCIFQAKILKIWRKNNRTEHHTFEGKVIAKWSTVQIECNTLFRGWKFTYHNMQWSIHLKYFQSFLW